MKITQKPKAIIMSREYMTENEETKNYYTDLVFDPNQCNSPQANNEFYMNTFRKLHLMVQEDELILHKTYPNLCGANQCFLFDKKISGYLEKVLYGVKGRRHTHHDKKSMQNIGLFKYQEGNSQEDQNLLVRCVKINERNSLDDEMMIYTQYILVHVFRETPNTSEKKKIIRKKIINKNAQKIQSSPPYQSLPDQPEDETEINDIQQEQYQPPIIKQQPEKTIKFLNQKVIDLEESLIKSEIEKKNLEIFLLKQKRSELSVLKNFDHSYHQVSYMKSQFLDEDNIIEIIE